MESKIRRANSTTEKFSGVELVKQSSFQNLDQRHSSLFLDHLASSDYKFLIFTVWYFLYTPTLGICAVVCETFGILKDKIKIYCSSQQWAPPHNRSIWSKTENFGLPQAKQCPTSITISLISTLMGVQAGQDTFNITNTNIQLVSWIVWYSLSNSSNIQLQLLYPSALHPNLLIQSKGIIGRLIHDNNVP
jgi:hypothetical protein